MNRIIEPPMPDWDAIPEAMKQETRWVLWRSQKVLNEKTGKWKHDKVPVSPYTGLSVNPGDPCNWLSFEEAQDLYRKSVYGGIGFALGDGWAGIDMDSCINADGYLDWGIIKPGINLSPELAPDRIVETFEAEAYIEYSPSGNGLHIITKGELPPGGRKLALSASDDVKKELACYDYKRFFTITGRKIAGNCVLADTTEKLKRLHSLAFPQSPVSSRSADSGSTVSALGDDDLIERASHAKDGDKFQRLWEGSHNGYPSQSEADLALCNILAFWTGRDVSRMDQLFRQSGLMREKWEREDYREGTIARACESTVNTYSPHKARTEIVAHKNGATAPAIREAEPPLDALVEQGDDTQEKEQKPQAVSSASVQEEYSSFQGVAPYPKDIADVGFYGPLGAFVRLVIKHTEADPNFLLISAMVAAGNVFGRNPYVTTGADRHHTNLFACAVGPTGVGRKGSAATPVELLLRHVDPDWCRTQIERGTLSTGEGLISSVRDRVIKPDEKNPDKIVEVDPGVTDKRVMFLQGEFSGALTNMRRHGSTLSGAIREAWDRGELATITKNSPCRATNAHISIVANVTKDDLQRGMAAEGMENGFANRFLWCCSHRSKLLPEGGQLNEMESKFKELAIKFSLAWNHAQKLGSVRRDADASLEWGVNETPHIGMYGDLTKYRAGMFGGATARAAPQVLRMALIYAILDQAAEIRKEHLLAAYAVWKYCEDSARYIFGDALGDPVADAILNKLRKESPKGLTRTEIRDAFSKNRKKEEIDAALHRLHSGTLARFEHSASTGRGRPTETWFALGRELCRTDTHDISTT